MFIKPLPPRPNLEQYKKQAKELVKASRSKVGSPTLAARSRLLAGSRAGIRSAANEAREQATWGGLAQHLAKQFEVTEGELIQRIKKHRAGLRKLSDAEILITPFALADAQWVIAREHGFESWPKFAKHIEALSRENSPVSEFEAAADAVINGDLATLTSLLRKNPELIRKRSTLEHGATLLHYVSANGVEDFRQQTPKNAGDVAKLLLNAGAEVDATLNDRASTTLGLVATSIHPARAKVQIELMELLLKEGANVDGSDGIAGEWQPLMAALHNHSPAAALWLADHGARVDNIISAAALGRLDLVKSYLNDDGSLNPAVAAVRGWGIPKDTNDPGDQLAQAFIFACMYGQRSVAEFLLRKGVDAAVTDSAGQTALHWAAGTGRMDIIKLLVERGAPLEAKNGYGGTVLDQTLWFAFNAEANEMGPAFHEVDYPAVINALIDAGAKTDVYPEMKEYIEKVLRSGKAVSSEQ